MWRCRDLRTLKACWPCSSPLFLPCPRVKLCLQVALGMAKGSSERQEESRKG